MKLFAIDIETVSQGGRADDYTNEKDYKAPSNYKDEEKIEANIEAQRSKARAKHGLHWWTGKVVSCAVVDVFGDTPDAVYYGHDEEDILRHVAEHIGSHSKLIGMCSEGFDFPFLVGRYMANMMRVPGVLKRKYATLDVNKFFGWSSQSGQRGKLDDYAQGIAYAGKPDNLDGSQVQGMYNTIIKADMNDDRLTAVATWKQLEKYNLHDAHVVKALATLYYRDIDEVM